MYILANGHSIARLWDKLGVLGIEQLLNVLPMDIRVWVSDKKPT